MAGRSVPEAFLLAFLLHRACETQIMAGVGEGGITPYIPPKEVIEVTAKQARAVTDGSQPFAQILWRSLLRRLDREAPDYCR